MIPEVSAGTWTVIGKKNEKQVARPEALGERKPAPRQAIVYIRKTILTYWPLLTFDLWPSVNITQNLIDWFLDCVQSFRRISWRSVVFLAILLADKQTDTDRNITFTEVANKRQKQAAGVDPSADFFFRNSYGLKTVSVDIRISRIYAEIENSANLRLNVNNCS